jgi:hypothetical protein
MEGTGEEEGFGHDLMHARALARLGGDEERGEDRPTRRSVATVAGA